MSMIKDLFKQLAATIVDLVTSKKAIAAAVAAIAAHVIKDPAQRAEVVAGIVAFIFSQGIVDHAKAAADAKLGVKTETLTASTSTPVVPITGIAGGSK
jgi:hypothetical protein